MSNNKTHIPANGKKYLSCLMGLIFAIILNARDLSTLNNNLRGTLHTSCTIKSRILARDMHYSVYLPPGYHKKIQFPVLYLLHGYGGNENSWILNCSVHKIIDSLINISEIPPMIVVMPNGGNSYFINDHKRTFKYKDFFIHELTASVDSLYKTIPKKQYRGIAGLSMGGFGAVILPVKHPEIFGVSVAFSAAVRTDDMIREVSAGKYEQNFQSLFGDYSDSKNRITPHWKANSPFHLITSANADQFKTIKWYIDCGLSDFLLEGNESLHRLLMNYNIPHEYHVRPGNHNWEFWNHSIIEGLKFFARQIEPVQ